MIFSYSQERAVIIRKRLKNILQTHNLLNMVNKIKALFDIPTKATSTRKRKLVADQQTVKST